MKVVTKGMCSFPNMEFRGGEEVVLSFELILSCFVPYEVFDI